MNNKPNVSIELTRGAVEEVACQLCIEIVEGYKHYESISVDRARDLIAVLTRFVEAREGNEYKTLMSFTNMNKEYRIESRDMNDREWVVIDDFANYSTKPSKEEAIKNLLNRRKYARNSKSEYIRSFEYRLVELTTEVFNI